ncbi:MAG: nuclear transport factor 2 family protein [Alphaproteobacteria bacterium]|nr:nuclear transport factor 2 family protein [Alphaproteobacteria bacterium]MBU1513080.1 nuclear transport factor 2 family protein [Alphaproteobacteria bacterium]MBU2095188.1 nuclear transport factor 2 family protein [Alphaproteobacteria bacterium]MBU2150653.1 nuclear transport factor 2 family protein [Alphaproteobacteria bacterium]MBU2306088.1 nuclear transport factor 2 family protein [Alphaproteobacteria bacterium]
MKRILSVLAVVLAMAASAAPMRAAAADSDQAKIAVAREMIAAWKAADWRKVGDLFAEKGVLRSMMIEPVTGREAIYQRIAALGKGAPGGVTLDVAHMGVIDGLVFIERTDRFVYNGKSGAVPVVGVLDIRDGKVQEWREYYDRAELMREMGVGEK